MILLPVPRRGVSETPADTPTVIAHRGCPARGPENTLAAFRRAAAHTPAVELDVRRCGSGELVVFHDERLDRLLGVEGRVADTDLDTLQSHAVGGGASGSDGTADDARVPTLSTALDAIPDDMLVNVELKEAEIAAAVADVVADAANDVLLSSFSPAALSASADAGDQPLAFVTAEPDWDTAVATATELGCVALHPQYELPFAPEGADEPAGPPADWDLDRARRRIATAHDHGLDVNVWTIRDSAPVAPLRTAGVDGLIVDDWADAEG